MIIDLIKDTNYRGYLFEDLAERFLRRKFDNYFIFKTSKFASLQKLLDFYCLKSENIDLSLISKYWRTIDVIQFNLDHFRTKNVLSIVAYEVKTKKHTRTRPLDVSKTANDRFIELKKQGIPVKILLCILYDNWRFSVNIHDYFEYNNKALRKPKYGYFKSKKVKEIILNPIRFFIKRK